MEGKSTENSEHFSQSLGQETSLVQRGRAFLASEKNGLREILRHLKIIFKHVKECADRQYPISTGDRARENMPFSQYRRDQWDLERMSFFKGEYHQGKFGCPTLT